MTSFQRIDFADAYEAPCCQADIGVEEAYWAVFGAEPTWVQWLMRVRGLIAVRLGLAHPFNSPRMLSGGIPLFQPGLRVGPFTVQSVSATELIVGDDDKHLNFRISCLKTPRDGQAFITLSTVVQIHNRLGHVYMFIVKPFHRFIAPFMVRRAMIQGRL
ncbi:DUF2867 domain-containing protein [Limnohabitans sp. T6-5]|uniref:DUF2867 domain-containing protein n=1 Tax=Limnohabitans sp. T6-5 TaxID=1100724 RepID=UPI001304D323|nr:DUF2867 domain-containing protein [Limnohabitans sp. T6-5]